MSDDNIEWHLDKRLSVGQIATTISIIGALIWTWNSFDKRLAVVETNQSNNNGRIIAILENQAAIDTRQDLDIKTVREETREDYQLINSKLDRLIERQ